MALVMGLKVISGSGVGLGENEHFLQGIWFRGFLSKLVSLIEEEDFLLLAKDAQQTGGFAHLRFCPTAPFQF